jgi:hypothetical protein
MCCGRGTRDGRQICKSCELIVIALGRGLSLNCQSRIRENVPVESHCMSGYENDVNQESVWLLPSDKLSVLFLPDFHKKVSKPSRGYRRI